MMAYTPKPYTGDPAIDKETVFGAIEHGDIGVVASFLEQGYPLGQRNGVNNTELGVSLYTGSDIGLLLLEKGAWAAEKDHEIDTLAQAILYAPEDLACAVAAKANSEQAQGCCLNVLRYRHTPRLHLAVWQRLSADEKAADVWQTILKYDSTTLKLLVEEGQCDIVHLVDTQPGWRKHIKERFAPEIIEDYIEERRAAAKAAREAEIVNTPIALPHQPSPTRSLRFKPKG